MSEHTIYSPLVGAYHRPPASTVLKYLPSRAELILSPEPENPYDPAAIKVLVDLEQVPEALREQLSAELPRTGSDWDELIAAGPLQLGYIAASEGKPLLKAKAAAPELELVGNADVLELMGESDHSAWLVFSNAGAPVVSVRAGA